MSARFTPVGPRARWAVLYELLARCDVGQVLTYQQMADALALHPDKDRSRIRVALSRAARELEQVDHRAVEAVTNVGYRVVEAVEHLRLARGHQKRAGKSLDRGHSKVVNVDLSALDPETRKAFGVVAQAFAMQRDFNRRLDVRQRRLEGTIAEVTRRSDRSDAELAALRERLERLEERRSP